MKTQYDLKTAVVNAGTAPRFFDRDTMAFFGDTMRNFGLRQPRTVRSLSGEPVTAWELYRRQPVKHGLHRSHWFEVGTLRHLPGASEMPE